MCLVTATDQQHEGDKGSWVVMWLLTTCIKYPTAKFNNHPALRYQTEPVKTAKWCGSVSPCQVASFQRNISAHNHAEIMVVLQRNGLGNHNPLYAQQFPDPAPEPGSMRPAGRELKVTDKWPYPCLQRCSWGPMG